MWEAFAKASLISSTKNINVFGYKVIKHLASSPRNKLVKLSMLWATEPRKPDAKFTQQNDDDTEFIPKSLFC